MKTQLPKDSNAPAQLTHRESVELNHCETVIQRGLESFVEVGQALIRIRDLRLYRQRYRNFKEYVRERWGMSARHAYRQCDGAEIFRNLLPARISPETTRAPMGVGTLTLPQNESQVRPLKGLSAEEQKETWTQAVRNARGAAVTAKQVQDALEQRTGGWPQPDQNGCYDSARAERFEFKHRSAVASLVVLQIGQDKWISRSDFKHFAGNHAANIGQLSQHAVPLTHRSYAIKGAASELISSQRRLLGGGDCSVEQRRIAQRILDWAMEFIRGERGKADNAKAENGKAARELTFEVEPKPKSKPREAKLLLAADQAITDVRALLDLTGMGAYRNVYLNAALERLEKFRESLENSRASLHDGRRGL